MSERYEQAMKLANSASLQDQIGMIKGGAALGARTAPARPNIGTEAESVLSQMVDLCTKISQLHDKLFPADKANVELSPPLPCENYPCMMQSFEVVRSIMRQANEKLNDLREVL